MVCKKEATTAALLITAILFVLHCSLSLCGVCDAASHSYGITARANLIQRFTYSLLHANLLHLLMNLWCFVAAVYLYRLSLLHILGAYIIAVAIPPCCLTAIPTVGLSGVCFALFGLASFRVESPWRFHRWAACYIIAGILLPGINGFAHLYAYIAGAALSLLNRPIPCKKK